MDIIRCLYIKEASYHVIQVLAIGKKTFLSLYGIAIGKDHPQVVRDGYEGKD